MGHSNHLTGHGRPWQARLGEQLYTGKYITCSHARPKKLVYRKVYLKEAYGGLFGNSRKGFTSLAMATHRRHLPTSRCDTSWVFIHPSINTVPLSIHPSITIHPSIHPSKQTNSLCKVCAPLLQLHHSLNLPWRNLVQSKKRCGGDRKMSSQSYYTRMSLQKLQKFALTC